MKPLSESLKELVAEYAVIDDLAATPASTAGATS